MLRHSYEVVATVLLVAVGSLWLTHLASANNLTDCSQIKDPQRTINGCTRLLQSGKLTQLDRATAYSNRGSAYVRKHQHDRAIRDYEEAIKLNPKYAVAYFNRGSAYDDMGLHNRAIKNYSKALQINPELASAYVNRGVAYGNKGRYERAIEDFDKAIELNSKDAITYFNRGIAGRRRGKRDKAIADFHKALELEPTLKEAKAQLQELGAER